MLRLEKRILLGAVFLWLLALALFSGASAAGLRLNISPSVPRGLYWLSSTPPVVGAYVAVCPPPSDFFVEARAHGYLDGSRCPGGFAELIKVFGAGPGDTVRIDDEGVRIDGQLWPHSAPRSTDTSGWALPQLTGFEAELPQDAVLVMSADCVLGLDARYFGPLPRSAIQGTAVLLLSW